VVRGLQAEHGEDLALDRVRDLAHRDLLRGAGQATAAAGTPEEITVGQIADAIEGQIFPMFCLEPSDHTCFQDSRCGLQGFWGDVALAIKRVFDETTVADLAERHRRAGPSRPFFAPAELLSPRS
jgi:DNA-binding IscR family transcriptional regulator